MEGVENIGPNLTMFGWMPKPRRPAAFDPPGPAVPYATVEQGADPGSWYGRPIHWRKCARAAVGLHENYTSERGPRLKNLYGVATVCPRNGQDFVEINRYFSSRGSGFPPFLDESGTVLDPYVGIDTRPMIGVGISHVPTGDFMGIFQNIIWHPVIAGRPRYNDVTSQVKLAVSSFTANSAPLDAFVLDFRDGLADWVVAASAICNPQYLPTALREIKDINLSSIVVMMPRLSGDFIPTHVQALLDKFVEVIGHRGLRFAMQFNGHVNARTAFIATYGRDRLIDFFHVTTDETLEVADSDKVIPAMTPELFRATVIDDAETFGGRHVWFYSGGDTLPVVNQLISLTS